MSKKIPSSFSNAESIFYFLQAITVYQDDPPDTELIQDAKSIFENNYYGIPGMGDCDCFTVLSISALLSRGYKKSDLNIVLAGRHKHTPVHIWLQVQGIDFDLTEPFFGVKRNYPYLQSINISKIWPE
jgi:hypothetical protein